MESLKKYSVNEKKKTGRRKQNTGKVENKWQDNGFKSIINYHIKCEWSKHHKKKTEIIRFGVIGNIQI